jgi:ubiquinone/menaquinone biosynthesis C-methylase UbiE
MGFEFTSMTGGISRAAQASLRQCQFNGINHNAGAWDMMRALMLPLHQVTMPGNALYTDLSGYYDLMCANIDYRAQSHLVHRLHQLFGNGRNRHLDLACGTGPHVRHFIDAGYQSTGLDINQPMLDRASTRCPEAHFSLQDMCSFTVDKPVDLITCFLYSIHYSASIDRLKACIANVYAALADHGVLCFNAVDKNMINNNSFISHTATHADGLFRFSSGWNYSGEGEQQSLKLRIEKTVADERQVWHDEHPMVAVSFDQLQMLLQPYFEVHVLEHDYEKIIPWDGSSGNAMFVCVKNE